MLYRALGIALSPLARWGQVRIDGLDLVPREGPLLLAPNHDSQMDPVLLALTLRRVRPVRFLARANLWRIPGLGVVLTGIGQIPIQRGAGDRSALSRAVAGLRAGEAICVFPEGQLSHGRPLRARTGIARLWRACPETRVVGCAISGTTGYARFPRRPLVTVRFLEPSSGQPRIDEEPAALSARLLRDVRAIAPPVDAGGRGHRAIPPLTAGNAAWGTDPSR